MSPTPTEIRRAEAWITEEHLQIRALLDRLLTMTDPYMLVLVMKDLRDRLEQHFNREEGDDGLYELIEGYAPEHRGTAAELLKEHAFFLAELNHLIQEGNALLSGPLAALKTRTGRYIERLEAHDVAETEILTDSLLGALDRGESPAP